MHRTCLEAKRQTRHNALWLNARKRVQPLNAIDLSAPKALNSLPTFHCVSVINAAYSERIRHEVSLGNLGAQRVYSQAFITETRTGCHRAPRHLSWVAKHRNECAQSGFDARRTASERNQSPERHTLGLAHAHPRHEYLSVCLPGRTEKHMPRKLRSNPVR